MNAKFTEIETVEIGGKVYFDAFDVLYWLKESEEILGKTKYVNGEYFKQARQILRNDVLQGS